jgi:subtilisin-like proprotein convertase family protein
VIDSVIGNANYDIGHTVSTGGGGLAQSPSVCLSNSKARGITGSPAPVGDAFDIDFVAHEIGHQFGASHTFNGLGGNCTTGTRSNAQAAEVGSGTTIMAYAGICSGVDVQPHSDDYFHALSIAQMMAHITGAGNCVTGVPNNNAAPVVNAGSNYTIPYGTAFKLTGSATDANGDALTYSWEQIDTQVNGGVTNWTVAQPPLATNNAGPTFRSMSPSPSPVRYLPVFSEVLAGNLAPTWEVIPGVARNLNFALTVRDNRTPNGGQTGRDDMAITVANTGPFTITSPNVENQTWAVGSTQTITWNVAGTTANGINTSAVNILLSTDAGATFGTVLASATANDGSETITLPAGVAVPYARILIEPVGNIYYAVSKSIAIGYNVEVVNTCNTYSASPNTPIAIGPNGPAWSIQGTVTIPDNFVISDLDLSVNITHPRINDLYIGLLPPGTNAVADILIVYQQGCPTAVTSNMITTFDDEGVTLSCGGIANNNTYKPLNSLTHFDGFNSAGGWRLVIADVVAANNGTLNSFAIEACSTTTTVTLGTESFGFSEFVVYPNPNNGNFNVRFADASANGVKVLVHDMRGRKIYENSYAGGASFNENIQLDNAQAGIYLMTVTDGTRKEVKRIVVE